MSLGLESLTSELDKKETAFQSLPQSELMKKRKLAPTGGLPRSLTDALVAEKVLNDKAAAANSMAASMESNPRTIAQQNEAEIENQTQQEVLKATAGVLQNKANRIKSAQSKRAMQQGMGIARAPVQQRQTMAQGGIVGYQDGGPVIRGLTPEERAQGSRAFDSVIENPLGALGYGLLGASSLTPLGKGAKFLRGLGGTKLGKKGIEAAKNLFTKQVPTFPKFPKNPKSISQLPPITKRVARPGRIAGAAGIGALIGGKLLNPNTPVEKELPDSTYDEVPNKSKEPISTGKSQAERAAALKGLNYIMSARGGLGSRGRAEAEFDQQEFSKKIDKDTLIAKQELNRVTSANVLQNRLTQVNAEIAGLQEQLSNTPINAELKEAEAAAIADPEDASKQERVRLLRIKSAEELERYADPLGSGDVGLLVQRQQLQARIKTIESSIMNDPMDAIVARNN